MSKNDIRLIEESFKRYYFDHFDVLHIDGDPSRREFGYQKFGSGMIRHVEISNERELRSLIMQNAPTDLYCSNGYYSFPGLPMSEKDWRGADLIFDIDAKDLDLDCRKGHVVRKCTGCGTIFSGEPACETCDSPRYESRSLPCKRCIDGAKRETKRLMETLVDDFGVESDSIHVYFSGNEGFHVHARDDRFLRAGGRERGELVDYIMFRGAVPERYGMGGTGFPEFGEAGLRGRVAKGIFGSKSKRSSMIKEIEKSGPRAFAARLEEAAPEIGARIDPNVTSDVHRIFRLAGSLNGKSGLAKIPCAEIDKFKPYVDACLISDDPVSVRAVLPVSLLLGGRRFGPYDDETVEVPRFAAVYMVCKGLARAV